MKTLTLALIVAAAVALCSANSVTDQEWLAYKNTFTKIYPSPSAENLARYYFAVNKQKIDAHNARAASNLESYTLGVNQYSDLRFLEFAALFPVTTEIPSNAALYTPSPTAAKPSFLYAEQGYSSEVQDQGTLCNSGWAHAAAVALKIFYDVNTAALASPVLSAQNFIDCAGVSKACTNQVSQIAFDYLTAYKQKVYSIVDYPKNPLQVQGVCALPAVQTNGKTLTAYSSVPNGNDAILMKVVNQVAPVVIKFNPGTFEFMHYKAGVFTQPAPTQSASHYMTVVGYATDAVTSKNYWMVQNSFGTTWGDGGFIKIERNAAKPIAVSAIFPSQL